MSVRALAAVAAFLLALTVSSALLLCHRLGFWNDASPPDWTFVNPTLLGARGQRVIVTPIVEGLPALRYTFLVTMTEPQLDDPMAPLPHLRAGVEEEDGDGWAYRDEQALALCQLGAMTPREWLIEIGPVEEVGGGRGGVLLRAVFGNREGATTGYFYDPRKPVPVVGWKRKEMLADGQLPIVHFASDGGTAFVPEKPQ